MQPEVLLTYVLFAQNIRSESIKRRSYLSVCVTEDSNILQWNVLLEIYLKSCRENLISIRIVLRSSKRKVSISWQLIVKEFIHDIKYRSDWKFNCVQFSYFFVVFELRVRRRDSSSSWKDYSREKGISANAARVWWKLLLCAFDSVNIYCQAHRL